MKEAAQKTKDTITTTETNSTAKEGASGHIRKTVTEKKPRPVFVIGHKNPDTDSICSAISYAWLKNQISDTEHLPKRAGNISRETQFVLDHFGVEAPELLTDVRPQIRDIDIRKAPGFDGHMSMREAWEYMRDNVLDTLCVTTENGSLEGLIAVKDIADAYLDLFDTAILGKAHTSYQNLLNTLEGKMLVGDPMGHIHKGRVHVGTSPETMISLISEGDIVLVTNRYEAQMIAIDLGASCMIVCVDSEVPEISQLFLDSCQVSSVEIAHVKGGGIFIPVFNMPDRKPDIDVLVIQNIVVTSAPAEAVHKDLVHDRPLCPVRGMKTGIHPERVLRFMLCGDARRIIKALRDLVGDPEVPFDRLFPDLKLDLIVTEIAVRSRDEHGNGFARIRRYEFYAQMIFFGRTKPDPYGIARIRFCGNAVILGCITEKRFCIHHYEVIPDFSSPEKSASNSSCPIFSFSSSIAAQRSRTSLCCSITTFAEA